MPSALPSVNGHKNYGLCFNFTKGRTNGSQAAPRLLLLWCTPCAQCNTVSTLHPDCFCCDWHPLANAFFQEHLLITAAASGLQNSIVWILVILCDTWNRNCNWLSLCLQVKTMDSKDLLLCYANIWDLQSTGSALKQLLHTQIGMLSWMKEQWRKVISIHAVMMILLF